MFFAEVIGFWIAVGGVFSLLRRRENGSSSQQLHVVRPREGGSSRSAASTKP